MQNKWWNSNLLKLVPSGDGQVFYESDVTKVHSCEKKKFSVLNFVKLFGRLELHTTVIRVDDVVFVVLCTNGIIIPSSCRWHFLTRFSTHRRG